MKLLFEKFNAVQHGSNIKYQQNIHNNTTGRAVKVKKHGVISASRPFA